MQSMASDLELGLRYQFQEGRNHLFRAALEPLADTFGEEFRSPDHLGSSLRGRGRSRPVLLLELLEGAYGQ